MQSRREVKVKLNIKLQSQTNLTLSIKKKWLTLTIHSYAALDIAKKFNNYMTSFKFDLRETIKL